MTLRHRNRVFSFSRGAISRSEFNRHRRRNRIQSHHPPVRRHHCRNQPRSRPRRTRRRSWDMRGLHLAVRGRAATRTRRERRMSWRQDVVHGRAGIKPHVPASVPRRAPKDSSGARAGSDAEGHLAMRERVPAAPSKLRRRIVRIARSFLSQALSARPSGPGARESRLRPRALPDCSVPAPTANVASALAASWPKKTSPVHHGPGSPQSLPSL